MGGSISLTAREQQLVWSLLDALHGSLDLQDVLRGAYAALCQLVPADQGSLCVTLPGSATEYDWAVAEIPSAFFSGYASFASEDFVRKAVIARPNVALRDSDMLPRRALEQSLMYQRCREIGLPLEQVMSVLLAVEPGWHGGVNLYRSRRRPFSERDCALLQRLTPSFSAAVRSCRRFGDAARHGAALEAALRREGMEVVVIAPPSGELARTAGVEALLARWFSPDERSGTGLPAPLLDALAAGAAQPVPQAPNIPPWVRRGPSGELRVDFVPLPEGGRVLWVLELREAAVASAPPPAWAQRLTARELQVAERVLRGWDNQLIADDLGCALGTVKKHLQRVYDELGVPSRAALLSLAARGR